MKNRKLVKWITFIFILLVMKLFFVHYSHMESQAGIRNYYIENGQRLTASNNIVTGIYLDFRMYDSLFEALILLTAAVGIHYLNREGDED